MDRKEMKDKELWMEKLKEKLDKYVEPVPPSSWEQLEKELMPSVEKKIYPFRRWTVAAAAALLVAVSSVSLYFLNTPVADEIRHKSSSTLANSPDVLPKSQVPEEQIAKIDPVTRPASGTNRNILAKTETQVMDVETIDNNDENKQIAIAKTDNDKKNAEEQTEKAEGTNQVVDTQPSSNARRLYRREKLNIPDKKPVNKGKWSMGLSVGNTGGATGEAGGNIQSLVSRVNLAAVGNGLMMSIPNDQTLVFEDGVPYLRRVKDVANIKHHQPISFGLSVRKGLSKGFSVETGLTYTLLSSDATIAGTKQEIEQKLHYVGIPIRANWNFVDKKLFTLYVSGGGMMEKCVYGKLGSEKETVRPLQFSVNGAVGAQINATNRIGFYVEPGVSYFFDDKSDIQTIRKENPLNFNIQAGIRLTY